MRSRRNVTFGLVLSALAFATAPAHAQEGAFPTKPITIIVPFAPGGTTDFIARIIQPKLQNLLGQPIIVENRSGAAGNIGMDLAARAPADGYTLMLGDVGTISINDTVFANMRVKPREDLTPISIITHTPSLLVVSPQFEPKTIAELVAYVKARPGKVSFASQGSGSQNRLAMEVFAERAGLSMVHVPYKGGSGPAAADLMGGHVPMMFGGLPTTLAHIKANRMRVLAIATAERHPALPDTPTFIEAGFDGMVMSSWQGLFVPSATPKPVIETLYKAVVATMADEDVKKRLEEGGLSTESLSPDEARKFIASETELWGGIARKVGAPAE